MVVTDSQFRLTENYLHSIYTQTTIIYCYLQMESGNIFSCMCHHFSLSVRAVNFGSIDLETSFLHMGAFSEYLGQRSSSYTKVKVI